MNRMHRLLNLKMKQFWIIAACVVLAMTIVSCGPTLSGALKWLKTQETAEPQINMTGRWDSSESVTGSWGAGRFNQVGARFTGFLDGYKVEGVVSGKEACFVFGYGQLGQFYSARVSLGEDGRLVGNALYNELIGPIEGPFKPNSYSMILKKVTD